MNTTCWYAVTAGAPLTAVSVTTAPALAATANTPITLTATATGGTNVQYQFWVYQATRNPAWRQLQAYSTSATCRWTPATAGNYLLSITACDGAIGTVMNTTCWYAVTAGPPLTAVSVATNPKAPQPANTPITLTATATGGTSVQYQFWVYNAAAIPAWSQLQGYSSSANCTWTPATAGNYLLSITAYDGATGMVVNTLLWYSISAGAS